MTFESTRSLRIAVDDFINSVFRVVRATMAGDWKRAKDANRMAERDFVELLIVLREDGRL